MKFKLASARKKSAHRILECRTARGKGVVHSILVGCAQTAAVLDESMIGGMGDCWDFIIGWLID